MNSPLLHANATPRGYCLFVKLFFAMWFVRYLFDPLQNLSELPLGYAAAVGFLGWMPDALFAGLNSYSGLLALRLGILLCCVGVWFGRTRLVFATLGCVLITTACGIVRGYGHINHAELGPLMVTWVLTLFLYRMPRDVVRSPDAAPNSTCSAGLICATLTLSLVYAFVGIGRLVHGGPELFFGDTMANHMLRATQYDWLIPWNIPSWVLDRPLLVHLVTLGTLGVTIVEIAAPFCLFHRKLRTAMLCIMPAFHIGAAFLFKVVFIEQPLALVLFVNLAGPKQTTERVSTSVVPATS